MARYNAHQVHVCKTARRPKGDLGHNTVAIVCNQLTAERTQRHNATPRSAADCLLNTNAILCCTPKSAAATGPIAGATMGDVSQHGAQKFL